MKRARHRTTKELVRVLGVGRHPYDSSSPLVVVWSHDKDTERGLFYLPAPDFERAYEPCTTVRVDTREQALPGCSPPRLHHEWHEVAAGIPVPKEYSPTNCVHACRFCGLLGIKRPAGTVRAYSYNGVEWRPARVPAKAGRYQA